MRRQIALFFTLAAALLPPAAAEGKGAFAFFEQLIAKPAATLVFRQTHYDRNNVYLDETNGVLAYQRPGKFRLQYDNPAQPLIIADGSAVWIYEEELRQVITQPVASAQKDGLWEMLASGNITALEKKYILSASVGSPLHWLTAEARDRSAALQQLAFGFAPDSGQLQQITLTDHFNNKVEMHINSIGHQVNQPEKAFTFIPPAGSEIIYTE